MMCYGFYCVGPTCGDMQDSHHHTHRMFGVNRVTSCDCCKNREGECADKNVRLSWFTLQCIVTEWVRTQNCKSPEWLAGPSTLASWLLPILTDKMPVSLVGPSAYWEHCGSEIIHSGGCGELIRVGLSRLLTLTTPIWICFCPALQQGSPGPFLIFPMIGVSLDKALR